MFPTLHLHLYCCPPDAKVTGVMQLGDNSLPTLTCSQLGATRFHLSFEQAADALNHLERLFLELDGSFAWTGCEASHQWQLDGMLYDHAGRVQRVELKGTLPKSAWLDLLRHLRQPEQPLIAHLLDHQCFVNVDSLESLWH